MKTARTWWAIAGLLADGVSVLVLAPIARVLQLVDDAHDTDPEGDTDV